MAAGLSWAAEALWIALEGHAQVRGDDCALIEPGQEYGHEAGQEHWSYRRLWQSMGALRDEFTRAGVGSDAVVAVLLADGAAQVIASLTAAGVCAAAPLNPDLTEAETEADLRQLGAAAVVLDAAFALGRAVAGRLRLPVILVEADTWRAEQPMGVRAGPQRNRGKACLLLYTSATTGRRKIVPITHGNLAAMLGNTRAQLGLCENDRLLLMARQFHTQGILSPFAQLLGGGSVIAPARFQAAQFVEWMRDLQPSWYACGPTLHRAILALLTQVSESAEPAVNSLRFVRSGGAPLTPELRHALRTALRVPVLDVYGLTETGALTSSGMDESEPEGSVGRSMGAEIALRDGEIVVRGPNVFAGYLDDDAANAEAFCEGWFRTGDLGRVDRDRFVFVSGRLKEIVNRGGQKVIPDEVDRVLGDHPAVERVATFAVPHASLGEDVACAVVLRESRSLSERELRAFAKGRLATYKLPRQVFVVKELPLGATGKPQRLELTRMAAGGMLERLPSAATAAHPPEEPGARGRWIELHGDVTRAWCEALRCERAGEDDDFFAEGGDSLAATRLLTELDWVFERLAPLNGEQFAAQPTILGLVQLLLEEESQRPADHRVLKPLTTGNDGSPALYLVPADAQTGPYFRRFARALTRSRPWHVSLALPVPECTVRPMRIIEDLGATVATAIAHERPSGALTVGGFCFGGLVAFEAARLLEERGRDVRIVLFDTPVPGPPRVRLRPAAGFGKSAARRVGWHVLGGLSGSLGRSSHVEGVLRWAAQGYIGFYRARTIRGPVLHVGPAIETGFKMAYPVGGWRRFAAGGFRMEHVPGNRESFLREKNLEHAAEALNRWSVDT